MELSTVSALAEARHTAYIRGRWVYSDIDGELQYKVVEPTLPSNGDYTPCFAWVSESKSTARSPDSETNQRNPAYTITAGLSNTSQFVSILTFYLDVILPRKQSYSEFCTAELSERAFARAVSKLNVNVLQLCFTQHVNPDLLHGQQTIRNLLLCLNEETSDLGRSGPFEVGLEIVQFVDDVSWEELSAATDSDGGGDDDDDDDDDLAGDWETVVDTNVPCAAEPSSVATRGAGGGESSMASVRSTTTRPDLHAHATPSIAGGLVSTAAASVASLWRWRTSTVVRKS
ncbi:PREDICTED: beclin 1-associated autophagy-related key regulator-like [Priapulus caudatus]|uniref:Beclin 1-associated autophagy-related key regulator-like n=1 Tax=Priapulus caudatus TaxID=37621 RepID=A0ABM1EGK8_PRICU|nr:PREDICTED: beclin 1-associated autophagy-related key regulator-like [Priapulus caudatus]